MIGEGVADDQDNLFAMLERDSISLKLVFRWQGWKEMAFSKAKGLQNKRCNKP